MNAKHQAKYLKDYQSPDYFIDHIALTFELDPMHTRVTAVSQIRANGEQSKPLILDGVDLTLVSVDVNGEPHQDYKVVEQQLIINNVPVQFELTLVTETAPVNNTSLEGLYLSGGAYCTQCEAEGFRKITYYLDRPDVLASFDVTVIADTTYPQLLSNGNKVDEGQLDDGRHFAKWQDPYKKPSYLFALVAGDFDVLKDTFTTQSGREVALALYVDKGNLPKAPHAMASLKNAMRWDEERFGLEYDLDIYMIVAVDFFNMGAMENKGLNIFNSKCVLANQETATDKDYHTIESIVGHEYFHNWTGNRVTCRDWFQLSLKEGLTVFRDQEFSSDLGSRALNRIDAVKVMRTHQFAEDAGPMSHPIRPEKVIEMNNFYTVTVYDKGAEVIRMMHTLLGEQGFRSGMDLYFERHDGQAVTCDDFVGAMMDATGKDLSQFKHWYSQSGTPHLVLSSEFDKASGTLTLTLTQTHKPTADQNDKQLLHIPFAYELLDGDGHHITPVFEGKPVPEVLDLTEQTQVFKFDGLADEPVVVPLENFSAPVILDAGQDEQALLHIMRYARSDFSRWDAQQSVWRLNVKAGVEALLHGENALLSKDFIAALKSLLQAREGDLALLAELLKLPGFDTLAGDFEQVPVDEICRVQHDFEQQLGQALKAELYACLTETSQDGSTDAGSVAVRALHHACLHYLAKVSDENVVKHLRDYATSDNMTLSLAALGAVVHAEHTLCDDLLTEFDTRWRHDVLVMDKWFALQAIRPEGDSVSRITSLYEHPCFELANPNRVRALVGSFCQFNIKQFHRADGQGYALLGDLLIKLNAINPQNASRLMTPLMNWRRFDATRQDLMKAQLERIRALPDLSDDLFEKVEKALG